MRNKIFAKGNSFWFSVFVVLGCLCLSLVWSKGRMHGQGRSYIEQFVFVFQLQCSEPVCVSDLLTCCVMSKQIFTYDMYVNFIYCNVRMFWNRFSLYTSKGLWNSCTLLWPRERLYTLWMTSTGILITAIHTRTISFLCYHDLKTVLSHFTILVWKGEICLHWAY